MMTKKETINYWRNQHSRALDRMDELEAEIKQQAERIKELEDFIEWLLRHITDTANAGFIIVNTDPQTIKLKAKAALKGDTNETV